MFSNLGRARADPSKKPGLDDFNTARVAGQVRKECLTHPATILPAAGSLVSFFWTIGIAASPISVGLFFGGIFVASTALIWNYVVQGESRVNAHFATLMAERRQAQLSAFRDFIVRAEAEGFTRGAGEGRELNKAFDDLMLFLRNRKEGSSLDSFRFRAQAAFEQGCSVLDRAFEVYKAMRSVDVHSLEGTVKALETELATLTDEDDRGMQQRQIEAHKKQLDFYHKKGKQLKELLTLIDEIEAALQTTYMGLLELGSADATTFLSDDGGAAKQLVSAFEAAQRVEARLKGVDDSASRERMQEYIKAAE